MEKVTITIKYIQRKNEASRLSDRVKNIVSSHNVADNNVSTARIWIRKEDVVAKKARKDAPSKDEDNSGGDVEE